MEWILFICYHHSFISMALLPRNNPSPLALQEIMHKLFWLSKKPKPSLSSCPPLPF